MIGLLEIAGRVVVVYVVCLVLLRLGGRRELSQLTPIDLLAMLLLSETVSPALTGGDDSVVGGVVAATTLVVLSVATARLAFGSRRAERYLHGHALVLIDHGRVRADVLREQRITDDDLRTALHKQGLLSVDQVERAYVEPGGQITVIEKKDRHEDQTREH